MQVQHELKVERVPWDSLVQHPRNPRNGDVDAIVESVRANGVYRPIIIASDGTILAGHHLWMALGEIGAKAVDVVRIPVHPASTEALRILLADNRTADRGTYDDGLLVQLLKEVDEMAGLVGTGYVVDDLDRMLAVIDEPVSFGSGEGVDGGPRCPNCGYALEEPK